MKVKRSLPARVTGVVTRFISLRIEHALLPARTVAPPAPIELATIRSVLVVRPDEIGDVVLSSAFLRELRKNLPQAKISLVVKPAVRDLVAHCPYVDEILTFGWSASIYWWPLQNFLRARSFTQHHLVSRQFDLAIVPRWDTDWYHASFLAYFSRATYRVGYPERVNSEKRRFNNGYDCLFTHLVAAGEAKHEVERSLHLLRYLGCSIVSDDLEVWTTPEDEANADLLLQQNGVRSGEMLVAFGVGSRYPRKMWPLENFIALAESIRGQYPCRILVPGDHQDVALAMELRSRFGSIVVDVTGRATLRQSAALLRRCRLYVGNDSGPKHLAAAVGVPVVEFSWSPRSAAMDPNSIVNRFKPWKVPYRLVQPERPLAPCVEACVATESHCIRGVTVEMAREAVLEQLKKGAHALPSTK